MNHLSTPRSIQMPSLSLPKGGGGIKSIGETFKPDAFTGAANYTINIPATATRGFDPSLSVNYSSGNGNGVFGMGFSLPLSMISIRTRLGIPQYDGADIFMLDNNELVLKNQIQAIHADTWDVFEYCPRVQADFSLIRHFIKADRSESYWEITTNDNTVSRYGYTYASRVYDPEIPAHIFQWLIELSTDARGNKIVFTYKAENNENVPAAPWEQNRSYNNQYIQKIQYANFADRNGVENFACEFIFDYGEYVLPTPGSNTDPYQPVNTWSYRPDAFSSYDSGFEIRTCRRCCNIMLFHLFENELGAPCLVNSVHFDYQQADSYNDSQHPGLSLLVSAKSTGYRRQGKLATDMYVMQSIPPVSLTYSAFQPPQNPFFRQLNINSGNIPGYLDSSGFQPVDLHGEGIAGLLYHDGESIYYYSPEGEGVYDEPGFPLHFPSDTNDPDLLFTDLDGDGSLDLLVSKDQRNGFYLSETSGDWTPFIPFPSYPTNINDPGVEMAGLSNNGKTDAIFVEQSLLSIYPSLGTDGYAPAITTPRQTDFPLVKQDYQQEYVGFADMAGDGLPHRVKVSNGAVEYWPDMGYGVFGKKITCGNAPCFDNDFDTSRLFLADIDGSGTTDLAYVYRDKIKIYINQCGNYFADPIIIDLPETWSENDRISFADIKGNGTQCLIFTKAGDVMRHYYYDFIGEMIIEGDTMEVMKPYLLVAVDNNMGAMTRLQYCSATKFYLEDKKAGDPWCTKLPFPVQVVEKSEVMDKINKACYTNRYRFHDGHYDKVEREFIGFGFVESWDAETYEVIKADWKEENYVPPVHTKTWYYTGAGYDDPAVMASYKAHFFSGDPLACDFPDTIFDEAIYKQDSDTMRQAWLSLRGISFRTEVYADDRDANPLLYQNPYTVTQSNQKVILYQPKGDQPYAVFMIVPRESISYHYERNPADPRVEQNFTLVTDPFGNSIESCTVYLSRRPGNDVKYPEQLTVKGILKYDRYVDVVNDFLYCHVLCEEQRLELSGITPDRNLYFSFDGIRNQVDTIGLPDRSKIIPYGQPFTSGVQARQISWTRHYFWNWAQPEQQPALGFIMSPGLAHHSEDAVFPKQFSIDAYDGRLIDEAAYQDNGYLTNVICTHGGYFYNPDANNSYWWNKGLVQYYLAPSFYLPYKIENSFARNIYQDPSLIASSFVVYDDYYLFVKQFTEQVSDNISNTSYAQTDYIACQPKQFTDINGNISQALFDPLGQVIVTTLFGLENDEPAGGMTLYAQGGQPAQYVDAGAGSFAEVINNPEKFLQGATSYFYYNLDAWRQLQQPVCAIQLTRYEYWLTNKTDNAPYCKVSINYTDGLGRDIGAKLKTALADQWQTKGRTVYNNKGKPCEQYFPYFSLTPEYEDGKNEPGPPPAVIHYDPLLRVIRTDTPKRFFSKVEFTPWCVSQFDEDDTVLDSYFYKNEYPGKLTPNEIDAIKKAVKFYNTPSVSVNDNRGFTFLKIVNNLGNVTKDAFISLQTPVISSEAIWENLLVNGYLAAYPDHADQDLHFLTAKFQPYTKGFALHLDPQYQSILQQITDILKEDCLTSFDEMDISGRVVEAIDPRLYYANIGQNTSFYNFKYRYAMKGADPVYIDSVDAGPENPFIDSTAAKHLFNIFDKQLWSWSPRSYCQFILYDRLQRQTALLVEKIITPGPVANYDDFNLVETFKYGENVTGVTGSNLRGQVYEVKDLSGIVTNQSYTMQGQPLSTKRQMVVDYKSPVDWSGMLPLLEATIYVTAFTYNAIQQVVTQFTPDGSVTTNMYDLAGRLDTVTIHMAAANEQQNIVENIQYNANGQRTLLQYGNGIVTNYTYEKTTLRLIGIKSTRPVNGNIDTKVQDVEYYYDPAGNITRTLDRTAEIIFCKNQRIDPLNNYTYNAIYQLITATGRQHIGISDTTWQNSSPDSFKQCIFGPPPYVADSDKLENYTENYSYDDSGNLIQVKHTASSTTSWTRDLPVENNSNRLQNAVYDASGNLRKLDVSNTIDLAWNCCENLVKAGIIQRLNEPDDCDYYMYDSNEMRTRKVSEKLAQGGTLTMLEDKVYVGNYEIKRNFSVSAVGTSVLKSERQTIRVMDDQSCVAIIYYTTQDTVHPEMTGVLQCRFQMDNNIGSVCIEMDEHAQLISYEEYFPYGGTSIITGIDQAEVKAKEYRYSGKELDDSTGLYYYGLRYYVPWQGRWLNADPAGTIDGLNLFAFVGGNPITHQDANGTSRRTVRRGSSRSSRAVPAAASDDDEGSEKEVKRGRKRALSKGEEGDEEKDDDSKRARLRESLKGPLTENGRIAPQGKTPQLRQAACWNWALNGGKADPNHPLSAPKLYGQDESSLFRSAYNQKADKTGFGGFGKIPDTPFKEEVKATIARLKTLVESDDFSDIKDGTPKDDLTDEQAEQQRQFMLGTMEITARLAGLKPNDQGAESIFTLHMQTVKGAFHTWEHWGIGVLREDGTRSIIQTLPTEWERRQTIKVNTEQMWDPNHVEAILGIDDLLPAHYEALLKK